MGRPIRYAPSEVRGTLERARHMIGIAPAALADLDAGPKPGFRRFIRREPLGVVFTVAAWNYPYLIAVNSVVPALMAGNAVILKHSAQTPLCAERFAECLAAAGLPAGVFQVLHLSHDDTERVIGDPRVDFVAFTGSVAGGHAVQRAAAERFVGVGLELGGCDPVYVRARCRPRARHREHRRRRLLQFRPVVLRTAAHLRAREPLRALSRGAASS